MRDHLIELLKKVPYGISVGAKFEQHFCEKMADSLLENGVIVPPCRVGDTVYFLHYGEILEATVISVEVNSYTNPQLWLTIEYYTKSFGRNSYKSRIDLMLNKTIFLTREEAERALEGGATDTNVGSKRKGGEEE